ncbi:hypothetical protein N0V90_003652 [Kalmusia sp. IMI 367209]|nr:hypothetical protein N0V90_003652 [Kalmusia sp. IMI 367209]
MRVFVTGASGFVGKAVTKELLAAGHTVLGLARSDESADVIASLGAGVHRGSLTDLSALKAGAASCDGVIHLAFLHDFASFAASAEIDRNAINALADALAGSNRPLLVTSGTLLVPRGRVATEEAVYDPNSSVLAVRGESEELTKRLASKNVRTAVVRLAPVIHGDGDVMFMHMLITNAREKGVSAYVGDGLNRWPATHVLDAAAAYRLAVEKAPAGSMLHAVAEEGVQLKDIATIIGKKLGVPVESKTADKASEHFGMLAEVVGADNPVSSAKTREVLGWSPKQRGLLDDLENGKYFSG